MLQNIRYYITNLVRDAHFWQRTDISGHEIKIKFIFSSIKWIIVALSILLALFTPSLGDNLIGYLLASFSIFIALFLQLIISIYARYSDLIIDTSTENKKVFAIQIKNFSKQFTSIMSYSILIAIFCVLMLSISLITDYVNICNTYKYAIDFQDSLYIIRVWTSIIYKSILFYFILDFFYLLIYGLTSFYAFVKIDIDSKKIKQD